MSRQIYLFFSYFLSMVLLGNAYAQEIDYFHSQEHKPEDWLYGSNAKSGDPAFDQYATIDMNIDIGIGADCGQINIQDTMKAALKNVLDSKYLGDMGKDIIGASPLLLTCYFSPTWCSILKHSRIQTNFLAQLRMNQCKAINKFTDQRVSDYYEERSSCIQQAIKDHNGNFEKAMESCKNYHDYNIRDWSGDGKKSENSLIEDTAQWANMNNEEARRVVDLTKALVGDTVVKSGQVSVDFGPRRVQLTPRTYLMEVRNSTFDKLCSKLLPKVVRSGGYKSNIFRIVSEDELNEISGTNEIKLDHQTILSLAYMPYKKRSMACRKLADALAMGIYTEDMGKTIDFMSSKMAVNPHLPEKRKKEADLKRRAFKDHVDITTSLARQNSKPLNEVLYQINKDGAKYIKQRAQRRLDLDQRSIQSDRIDQMFFDCADGIGCKN